MIRIQGDGKDDREMGERTRGRWVDSERGNPHDTRVGKKVRNSFS